MKIRKHYDPTGGPDEFKQMTMELANAKGSLEVTATELVITSQILTRLRRKRVASQNTGAGSRTQLSQEQQESLRLRRELKQVGLERITQKATGIPVRYW